MRAPQQIFEVDTDFLECKAGGMFDYDKYGLPRALTLGHRMPMRWFS
jgi:hypothetical protein